MDWWQIMLGSALSGPRRSAEIESRERVNRILELKRRHRRERQKAQASRDDDQDAQITALRSELDQVQVALGALSQLLVDRGVLQREQLTELIEMTVAEKPGAAKQIPPAD